MKRILLFITLIILILSCSQEEEPNIDFKPNQKTTLQFNISNCDEPKGYSYYYWQTMPFDQINRFINFSSDTTFALELDLNHPLYIRLYDTRNSIDFFVIPNDTLYISIDLKDKDLLKETVTYKGTTGQISDYLTRTRQFFYASPKKDESPDTFNKTVDSFYSYELDKLDSAYKKKGIPKWFMAIEKENISHERDKSKFFQYMQRAMFHNRFIPKGDNFRNNIDLGEMDYYWLFNTQHLLNSFRPDKYDTLLLKRNSSDEVRRQLIHDNVNALKTKIPESVLSYNIAHRLSHKFRKGYLFSLTKSEFETCVESIDEFIEYYSHLITDTALYNFVNKEKNKAFEEYHKRSLLMNGDTAPNFYLSDTNGDLVKLIDFKGKVVLLNFWGTYCSPCIKSIPNKNKLVEEFNPEDFVLINIIVDSNLDRWKEILKERNFKGVHLVCKGNWNDILRTKYNITSIPHYTLVGKGGLVIKNNITDSLEFHIRDAI